MGPLIASPLCALCALWCAGQMERVGGGGASVSAKRGAATAWGVTQRFCSIYDFRGCVKWDFQCVLTHEGK
jgi:hypothetical protein